MNKRPVDILKDDFNRVIGLEFERGFIGSESKLISCSHRNALLLYD
jgi:hypothetical protein